MISGELKHLVIFACLTRLLIFVIQFGSNAIIRDHQADAFKPIKQSELGYFTNLFLGGFAKWDSQYFIFIAKYGYVLETSLAFFPLLPIFARFLSGSVLLLLSPFMTQEGLLLMSMVALNAYCFVQSAILHYRLARDFLKSHHLSLLVAMLFCINPASIFMTAAYTESLYHMLLLFGLVYLRSDRPFLAALCFSLSAASRSNGMTNVIYLILYIVHVNYVKLSTILEPKKGSQFIKRIFSALWTIIDSMSTFSFMIIACVAPYFIFQYFGYAVHCLRSFKITPSETVVAFAKTHKMRLLNDESPSEWCNHTLPFSYPFLQQHYWGVGFLSYFEVKQIPNFLLASPVVILASCCLFTELREHYIRVNAAWQNKSLRLLAMSYSSALVLVLTLHLGALLLIGVFIANVQIITRLIFSSSPLIYWYVARIIYADAMSVEELQSFFRDITNPAEQKKRSKETIMGWILQNPLIQVLAHWHLLPLRSRFVLCYFLSYFFVGTLLFANFLPWT